MWSIVIATILLFSLGLMMMAWLLQKIDPERIDPEWLSYGNCCWFSFSTFIGESVMRYEGSIDSGIMKIVVMIWYLYALIATSSYAGEIRSFFVNPGNTAPLGKVIHILTAEFYSLPADNLGQVVTSDLGWGLILYGEEEEKVMAASSDPVISKIWKVSQCFTADHFTINFLLFR